LGKNCIFICITLPAEKIQCQNLPLENVPVAFAVGGSFLMFGKKTGKKLVVILNAKENTIEDNVQNGTKKTKNISKAIT
jgi:hypothetical protein